MAAKPRLLIAFYGDDFTGSTDALEFLNRAGIKTALFIEPPSEEQLSHYEGLQAIGVAGMTRAMVPADMEDELSAAFSALRDINPQHVHYKVCSTFDSSSEIGSIGKAIDIGTQVFDSKFVPLLVAAPILGRHCVFGNLFARMGIGSNGEIFRLDRHPSMSNHPVTPANESDLRLHLSKQTNKNIGLLDILQIEKESPEAEQLLNKLITEGNEVILFDALYQEQLAAIGKLIDLYTSANKPLFSVGSSGIEMALGGHWQEKGIVKSNLNWSNSEDKNPILVISGSCSSVTSSQITYSILHGFKEIAIDTEILAWEGISSAVVDCYANQAAEFLQNGLSVIIHTSLGNDDGRVINTGRIFKEKGIAKSETSLLYGTLLGQIARNVAEKIALKRMVIAGGDTSSYAARAMGIEAVEMISPLSPGAPLCKAYAPNSSIDGMEVNFKGGQVGKDDYFQMVARGIYT